MKSKFLLLFSIFFCLNMYSMFNKNIYAGGLSTVFSYGLYGIFVPVNNDRQKRCKERVYMQVNNFFRNSADI